MEELLLMNPKHGGKHRYTYVDFPKNVRHTRINPAEKTLPVVGMKGSELMKDGIGAGIGLLAPMYVPKMLGLKGWSDVAASGVTTVVGAVVARQVVGKTAGNVALATGAIVTLLKAVRVMKGGKKKKSSTLKGLEEFGSLGGQDDLLLDETDFTDFGMYRDDLGAVGDVTTIRSY